VLKKVVDPFGIYRLISTTDIANRSIVTGRLAANTRKTYGPSQATGGTLSGGRATVTTQSIQPTLIGEYDPTKPTYLKDFDVNQLKPHPGEGA
jgi:hypothetical protein